MTTSESARRKITDLAGERAKIERQISEAQKQHSRHNADASKYRVSAQSANTDSTRRSRERSAESASQRAQKESAKLADLYTQRARNSDKDLQAQKDLASALKSEDDSKRRSDRRAARESEKNAEQAAARQRAIDRKNEQQRKAMEAEAQALSRRQEQLQRESTTQFSKIHGVIAEMAASKAESLRVVYATAAPGGDLRLDKEIRRVRLAVQSATHRDLVEINTLTAATTGDLLDALMRHKPHVVHFSGHANEDVLLFDNDNDNDTPGRSIPTGVLARAIGAVDHPPIVVVLNACESASQLEQLVNHVPVAIGMSASVMDVDAITFATRFYSALAEGQSLQAAMAVARVDMEMNGLEGHDLPTLRTADGVDPSRVVLVQPAGATAAEDGMTP